MCSHSRVVNHCAKNKTKSGKPQQKTSSAKPTYDAFFIYVQLSKGVQRCRTKCKMAFWKQKLAYAIFKLYQTIFIGTLFFTMLKSDKLHSKYNEINHHIIFYKLLFCIVYF